MSPKIVNALSIKFSPFEQGFQISLQGQPRHDVFEFSAGRTLFGVDEFIVAVLVQNVDAVGFVDALPADITAEAFSYFFQGYHSELPSYLLHITEETITFSMLPQDVTLSLL